MLHHDEIRREAARLREIRGALGLSRNEMAARLDVSPLTVKGAENGSQRLGARKFAAAERLAAEAGLRSCAEAEAPYHVPPPTPKLANLLHQDQIATVLAVAATPEIRAAAEALARALGISEDEALARVVRAKLEITP